jgi:plastocyanin
MKIAKLYIGGLATGILLFSSTAAFAEEEIHLVIKDHQFSPAEIKIKAQTKTKLVITNQDNSAEEFESFSLNREKIIRPGQTATIFLPPLKPGTYDFFGEFHPDTAKGKIIVE